MGGGIARIFRIVLFFACLVGNARAEDWLYTVQPGDYLWKLSEEYLVHVRYWRKLQALNKVGDPYHLPPGTTLRIPLAWMKTEPVPVTVLQVQGRAEAVDPEFGKARPLQTGQSLKTGDEIRTGADSNATLQFANGSRILLQEESDLEIVKSDQYHKTEITDIRLDLDHGRTETQVKPQAAPGNRFEIRTPSIVTSVRGTDFRVEAEATKPIGRAETLTGEVAVAGGSKTMAVRGGFGTVAERGRPPLPPVKLLPPPDVSALPRLVERVPTRFALPELAGARAYRTQISPEAASNAPVFDRISTAPVIQGPDLPDGQYVLRVRGIDKHGLEGRNAERHFTLNARPEPPMPMTPAPGAPIPDERPGFQWSEPENVQAYHFQLASDQAFKQLLMDRPRHSSPELAADPLKPAIYFWRVATIDTKGEQGPFSDPQEFRRTYPAPELKDPEVDETHLTLRWRAGEAGQKYHFQMAGAKSFAKPLVDQQVTAPEITAERPKPGTYYVRASTIEADGFEGPYGPPQRIEVREDQYWPLVLTLLPLLILL
jgi:hypothetical protein